MTDQRTTSWIERLDAVMVRLQALAGHATGSSEALTDADPETGERWEEGQVWSHMAEFIPYWLVRCRRIADEGHDEPVPFGRGSDDPERVAGIQLGREMPIRDLFTQVRAGAADVRQWLEALPDRAWEGRAAHQTLGVLSLDEAIQHYLVGHMEDHAEQLEALVPSSDS
jgi:hypothetical protein